MRTANYILPFSGFVNDRYSASSIFAVTAAAISS